MYSYCYTNKLPRCYSDTVVRHSAERLRGGPTNLQAALWDFDQPKPSPSGRHQVGQSILNGQVITNLANYKDRSVRGVMGVWACGRAIATITMLSPTPPAQCHHHHHDASTMTTITTITMPSPPPPCYHHTITCYLHLSTITPGTLSDVYNDFVQRKAQIWNTLS